MSELPSPKAIMLETIAAEIEECASQAGWDRPPSLYALVPTQVLAADPSAASVLSPGQELVASEIDGNAITPIAQEELPDEPLDEVLAQIGWPPEVVGCALSQEIVMLPPSAESEREQLSPATAADHPERREARLVVAVLRDGRSAAMLRLRGTDGTDDDLLTGPDLAPNLVTALRQTLAD